MPAVVCARFQDRETFVVFEAGQPYTGTPERIAELVRKGFLRTDAAPVSVPEAAPEPKVSADPEPAGGGLELGEMTNNELVALLRELGVEPPRKANKATLVRLAREATGE